MVQNISRFLCFSHILICLSGQFVNKGSCDQNIAWDLLRIITKHRFQTSGFNSSGINCLIYGHNEMRGFGTLNHLIHSNGQLHIKLFWLFVESSHGTISTRNWEELGGTIVPLGFPVSVVHKKLFFYKMISHNPGLLFIDFWCKIGPYIFLIELKTKTVSLRGLLVRASSGHFLDIFFLWVSVTWKLSSVQFLPVPPNSS